MSKLNNLTGRRFGRLIVIKRGEDAITPKGTAELRWECLCDCGQKILIRKSSLRDGKTKSCGCLKREVAKKRATKHGMYSTSEHLAWRNLKGRCDNPKDKSYKNYGGRGITYDERWNFFENFYSDMGPKPGSRFSIDRIDNNKGYSRENCRWATPSQQARNKRLRSTNKSGYTGVYWNKKRNKWAVEICVGDKQKHIGLFFCLLKAAAAYREAESKMVSQAQENIAMETT